MDLENEELKATRKLNGVAKESNIDKLIKLKEISKRFNNGTETIEDIMYYCRNYEIKFENGLELRVVEKRYFDKLVKRIKKLEEALLKVKDKNTTLFITCRNSIPKQKVKGFINKLKLSGGSNGKDNVENLVRELAIEILEELLEDK